MENGNVKIMVGNCFDSLFELADCSIDCCVTSPPYFGLRDYGVNGQIGLEETPEDFIAALVAVFREIRRVLKDNGTLWLNIGDSYCAPNGRSSTGNSYNMGPNSALGHLSSRQEVGIKRRFGNAKTKDLLGIPWMLAFALRADGWYLRQDIIWHKPNAMPESVKDRCTKAHEFIFLLSKSPKYYFDSDAMLEDAATKIKSKHWTEREYDQSMLGHKQENGVKGRVMGNAGYSQEGKRNKRSVWSVPTKPYKGAHFATFPPTLIEPCILAGCPIGGTVIDPFAGSGTTAGVALANDRKAILCELSEEYAKLIPARIESIIKARSK